MQPVSSIHTGANLEHELSVNMDSRIISALWVVAILALLMSWIIFINFQITQTIERAKEMGLKKVVGANSVDLAIQIVLQSVLVNAVSMILAFWRFICLRRRSSVSPFGALLCFFGCLARLSRFVSLFRPPSA